MDVLVYELDGNLYINLTNRCSNDCRFCVRSVNPDYYGNDLWLSKEPTAEEVIAKLPDKNYNEVVFCGYGELTFRIDELVKIGKELKKRGYIVRLNTNGQGNLINGRDITEELAEGVDKVNVSLNAGSRETYYDLCRPVFGEDAYDALIEFAKECKRRGMATNFSIVDCMDADEIELCKKTAENAGIPLRIRSFIK